ncbi:DNA-directed RNA polymerase subunit alpha C-terminal domain-containing protein [Caballeronia zhejiangensis]|uniref:DNA-directed RNA polymerase subunit alpha C-terminal domain-containing protein n=1 Tax=Caballeronia zhejiangensis TaxID=871203 RepID=UPI00158E606C|nr:DNA-binding protein [Caballeronia zhejiangensis]
MTLSASACPTRAALALSKRICTALDRAGLRTVDQIIKRSADSLRSVNGLGPKSMVELRDALSLHGLALAKEIDDEQS